MNKAMCQVVSRSFAVLSALCALLPAPAWACTRLKSLPTLMGEPDDNAIAVPTNVVLRYELPYQAVPFEDDPGRTPGEYILRRSNGEQVELRATRSSQFQIELLPAQLLQPNTSYTLEAHWRDERDDFEYTAALTFETGDGPLDETPEPPRAVIRNYELDQDYSAWCGPRQSGSCISVQDDQRLIEYTFIDDAGEETWVSLVRGSLLIYDFAQPGGSRHSNCVDVRHFSANGTRSQPLRLCGQDAPLRDLTHLAGTPNVLCTAAGLDWCDSSGETGNEPGPDNPRGVEAALSCELPDESSSVSSQSALAGSGNPSNDAGAPIAAPAAGSCSASLSQPSAAGATSVLMILTSLFALHARRRRRQLASSLGRRDCHRGHEVT